MENDRTMNDKPFDKFYWVLREATHYMSVTYPSELIKLTPTDKIIYSFMLHRYNHFKGNYRDKQGSIADACGLDVKTVHRCIKGLVDNGVIEVKYGAKYNILYKKIYGLSLYKVKKAGKSTEETYLDDMQVPDFLKKDNIPVKKTSMQVTQKIVTLPQTYNLEDPFFTDDKCPF